MPEDKSPPPVTNGTFVRPKRPCAFAPHIQSMAPASVRPLPNINSFQRPAAPLPVIHLPSPYPPQQQHIILQQKWNMWQSILLQINPSFSQFKMLVNMKMQNPMCAIESLNGINQVLTTIQRPVLFEIIDANFTAEVEHLAANLRDFINSEECSVSKGAKTAMNTGLTSALNTFLHLTQRPEPQLSFAPQVRPPFMPFYG